MSMATRGMLPSDCQEVHLEDGLHVYLPRAARDSTFHVVAVKGMFIKLNEEERERERRYFLR